MTCIVRGLLQSSLVYWFTCILQEFCCSLTQSCPTLSDLMDCSMPGSPVLQYLLSLLSCMSIESVMPFNHFILCRPLFLLPSIFPSIRVFSSGSALCDRPKYWSFSFSISPSNEYSGLISSRIDWFDLLAVQGTARVFSSITVQKHQFFSPRSSLWFSSQSIHDYWRNP